MARTYPEHPWIGVGAIIRDGHGRALVVQRGSPPEAGTWSFPGGGLNLGERLADGVAREAWEETGLEVIVHDVLHVAEIIDPAPDPLVRYHFVVLDYGCDVRAGEAQAASDATRLRWVTERETATLPLTTGMAACLASPRVRRFLGWDEGDDAAGRSKTGVHEA